VSANLDLVRSIYADWEHGKFSNAEWADREIEYVFADGPQPGTWTGVPAMAEGFRAWVGAWEHFRAEAQEYRELDDERVLVLVDFSGLGKASGLEIRQAGANGAHLFHIRDGRVIKIVNFLDRDRALADLGLAAEDDS
jgi:ketosteroid isomerase-like protein